MIKLKVTHAPISYNGTLYQPGEIFEATEEEAAGWLQANMVERIPSRKGRK
jgi:hypothetical protein